MLKKYVGGLTLLVRSRTQRAFLLKLGLDSVPSGHILSEMIGKTSRAAKDEQTDCADFLNLGFQTKIIGTVI